MAYDTDEFSENGTVGDPRERGSDRGEALLEDASAALSTLLDRVRNR